MPEGEVRLRPEIETLSQKLEVDPKSKVFAQLADAYRKSNMVDEAIEIAKKGLGIHPNYAAAHLVLGRSYLEKRIYSLAREELERVASLDPHNAVALKLLADVHFSQGAKEEAVRRYRQVLDMDPLNTEVAEKLAQLLSPPEAQDLAAKTPEPATIAIASPPAAKEEPAAPPALEMSDSLILGVPLAPPQPEPRSTASETSPAGKVGGRLPPRTTLTGEEVSNMVEKMFVEERVEPSTIPSGTKVPTAFPEPDPRIPSPTEGQTTPDLSPAFQELPLGNEEVNRAIEGLLNEESRVPSAPVLPETDSAIPPESEASELGTTEAALELVSTFSEPITVPLIKPLSGEEAGGIVEDLLAERKLGVPAISPPEAPQMIEQKPPEAAPLVKVEEAAVPAKAKSGGATATLAELYEQQGFYDKALELYEQVLSDNPEKPALQAKVRELKNKMYLEEGGEPGVSAEAPPIETLKLTTEVHKEEFQKEEPTVEPPKVEELKPLPKAEEAAAPTVLEEKTVSVQPESTPQPSTPLFHPETGPKPEGVERKGEIKSFQEWLDSLKKPKPGT